LASAKMGLQKAFESFKKFKSVKPHPGSSLGQALCSSPSSLCPNCHFEPPGEKSFFRV
jgi:hypothetical protein